MPHCPRAAFLRSLLLAALAAGMPLRARAQGLLPVRAAITPIYYDAVPILYAQKMGLFAKAGIDLQLGRLPTGAAIMAAVAGGHLDVGKSSFATVVSAFGHGIPITLIAPGAVYDAKSPNSALLVAKDAPIRTAADLNGKVIALNDLTAPTRPALSLWLEQNGQSKDAVKYVEILMNAMPAAIDEHRVDGMMLTSPLLDEALGTGKYRVLAAVLSFVAPRLLFSAYVATHDWAAQNAEAVKRFAGVIVAAAAYTNAHHAEMTPLIADLVGATPAAIARMTWPTGGTALLPAEIQPMIDISAKYGFTATRFDARQMIFDPTKA
jgi:NitT/TauT family transport system substrate-binding protein